MGQNLVTDGSFETISCPDNSIGSFYESEYWTATGADAYLLNPNCELDPYDIQSIIAINTEIIPYEGSAYVSLEGLIFKNGFCLSEGVSQRLEAPVRKGSFYYFELASLKYNLENPIEEIPSQCSLFPDRGLELRLDNQQIKLETDGETINFQPIIYSYETTSDVILDDIHINEISSSATVWDSYWTCFEAQEDYDYIGITGPNKFFDELNECMEDGLPGIQHLTGYAIDNIQLHEIPLAFDTTIQLCRQNAQFSIFELVSGPFVEKASFNWNDGKVGPERSFSIAGSYVLNMDLPCVSIPVTVEIVEDNCDVIVYVPNVISVHDISPNNQVKPILLSDFLIEDYLWNIYDRWGNLVFNSRKKDEFWDGTQFNRYLETGVYVWKLQYSINNGRIKEEVIGSITLLK